MAARIKQLLNDAELRRKMSAQAAEYAPARGSTLTGKLTNT